jgi:hypothetical protein
MVRDCKNPKIVMKQAVVVSQHPCLAGFSLPDDELTGR